MIMEDIVFIDFGITVGEYLKYYSLTGPEGSFRTSVAIASEGQYVDFLICVLQIYVLVRYVFLLGMHVLLYSFC